MVVKVGYGIMTTFSGKDLDKGFNKRLLRMRQTTGQRKRTKIINPVINRLLSSKRLIAVAVASKIIGMQ